MAAVDALQHQRKAQRDRARTCPRYSGLIGGRYGVISTGRTAASTTLGDLHSATPWLWLHCEKCRHYSPLACAVPVIRWGAGASSDVLRRRARCTACGHKGATLQLPSWVGADVGMMPFPAGRR